MDFIIKYSLWLLLMIGTGFSFYWLMRHRKDLQLPWWVALLLSVLHTLIGVLSVKVFAVLETLDLSKAGNMSIFGGVFFMPLMYVLGAKLFRRKVATVCDVFTPCMVFTLMCARVNCILSGCCLGAFIPGTDGLRFPTRELEIVFYIAVLIYLWYRERKPTQAGMLYPLYMAAYGVFRFVVEFFRVSDSDWVLHISHIWAVLAFLIGASMCMEIQTRAERKKNKRRTHL